MEFQKAVLIIALVILIISVIIISAVINKSEKNKKWPPEEGTCPPYFTLGRVFKKDDTSSNVDEEGERLSCIQQNPERIIGTGDTDCKTLSLYDDYGKPISRADKRSWAEKCKIKWDGYN